ncbi:MAG: hypothetical protein M0R76_12535 [Proteobacteria bacterium]|nr:hypothetical protein [Pseudomonadota bacterium]
MNPAAMLRFLLLSALCVGVLHCSSTADEAPPPETTGAPTDSGAHPQETTGAPTDSGAHPQETTGAPTDSGAHPQDTTGTDTDVTATPQGIADNYPGDIGIADDPAVLFFDDFERYTAVSQLWDHWTNVYQSNQTHIVTDADNVFAGRQSVSFTLPTNDVELSNALERALSPEVDVLYLRWYQKIDRHSDIVGSHHNGGGISAHYKGPAQTASEAGHFLAAFESWREDPEVPAPGHLNAYVYHIDQRTEWGDHFFPTGLVKPWTYLPFDFGPDFAARDDIIPELDRWHCFEIMVRANTIGERDGEIGLWFNGASIARFGNLQLREDAAVQIDRISVSFHAGKNEGSATTKYIDNVVAATSYIGPMATHFVTP